MGRERLTLSDRIQIESGLYAKRTLKQIAASMNRSLSTISREIQNNRTMVAGERLRGKDCAFAGRCFTKGLCGNTECQNKCSLCPRYDCTTLCKRVKNLNCLQLEKPPFVCNTCPDRRKCRKNRACLSFTEKWYESKIYNCIFSSSSYILERQNTKNVENTAFP